jgi:hypothetical protein
MAINIEVTNAETGEKQKVDSQHIFGFRSSQDGEPSELRVLGSMIYGRPPCPHREESYLKIKESKDELRAAFQREYDALSKDDRKYFDQYYSYPDALVKYQGE